MKRRPWNPNPDAAWYAAHRDWVSFRDPVLRKDQFRLLRASTEYWTASALWKKSSGAWSCVSADSQVSWMIGKTHEQVHLELLKLQADYSWIKGIVSGSPSICSFIPDQSASQTNEAPVRPTSASSCSQASRPIQAISTIPLQAPRSLEAPHRPVACVI